MATHDQNILAPWHGEVLPGKTRSALIYLSAEKWLENGGWYLAGGTAMALQAGHRVSVDLDFFTTEATFSEAELTARMPQKPRGSEYRRQRGMKCGM